MWQTVSLVRTIWQQKRVLRMTPAQIQGIQKKRLRCLVAYAKEHSPFYSERLRNINPDRFDLRDLPTVNKTEMMENFDRFLTVRDITKAELEEFLHDRDRLGEWYKEKYALSRTSGTQGLKAFLVQDRAMMQLLFALQITRGTVFPTNIFGVLRRLVRRARLAVVTIGHGFYPSASALVYEPKANKVFVNRLWIRGIDPLSNVVDQLNDFQPDVLLCYANVLEILAREVLQGRLKISADRSLKQIINISEPLSQGAKKLASHAFGIPITDSYAMGECPALSVGCLEGHGMHLQGDWAVLEVVDRDYRAVGPGQPGEKVLVTNLYNTVQPFIRYEIEDMVTMSPNPCPCGNPLPLIEKVDGRRDEMVWIGEDGSYRRVHPYVFLDVLDQCPELGWYQLVQVERNRFLLRASPAPQRTLTRDSLKKTLQRGLESVHLDGAVEFDIDIRADVKPDPNSGKLRRITSKVGPPKTAGGQAA